MRYNTKWLVFFGIVFLFVTIGGLFATEVALAQDFGTGYLSGTNLPSEDLRTLVVRIINVTLGVLGTIFLLFVLYGGFLWMTARGNQQQVAKAQKILINATTGLIIIFMAFAITALIFNILGDSDPGPPGVTCIPFEPNLPCHECNAAGNGWNYMPGWPGCGLLGSEFRIRDINTAHGGGSDDQDVYLCSSIQALTNNVIDQSTVDYGDLGSVNLTTPTSSVSATLAVTSRGIEIVPNELLIGNWDYVAHYDTSIKDTSGLNLSWCDPLTCSQSGSEFLWNFTTGVTVDNIPPEITQTRPLSDFASPIYPDRNVNRDKTIQVWFSETVRASTIDDGSGHPVAENIIIEQLADQGTSQTPPVILNPENFTVYVYNDRFDLVIENPDDWFEAFTWYRVTVQNIQDLCGNTMEDPLIWEFQTNDVTPGVGSWYPTGNNICPNVGVVTLTFNTSMYYNEVTIEIDDGVGPPIFVSMNAFLLDPGPYEVNIAEGTWSVNPMSDFRVFTFTFNGSLFTNTNYDVDVTTDRIIDVNGNYLEHSWFFGVTNPESCTCSPYISNIVPDQGLLGECVTIFGQCFTGTTSNPADISSLSFETQVPPLSTISTWPPNSSGSNYIVTTIPDGFIQYDGLYPQVGITYTDGNLGTLTPLNSNVYFYVGSDELSEGPCLLSVNPNQACYGNPLQLGGIRLGDDPGVGNRSTASHNVGFNDGALWALDPQVSSWSDTRIDSLVPAGTIDEMNIVVTSSSNQSNPLPFDLSCPIGSSCTSNPDPNICDPDPSICDPGLDCNIVTCLCETPTTPTGPTVTDYDPTCNLSCTNVEPMAVFSEPMDGGTIDEGSIDVRPCGVDCSLPNLELEILYKDISYDDVLRRVSITSASELDSGIQYRVILRNTIISTDGLALAGLNFDSTGDFANDSFSWTFGTKDGPCELASVSLTPISFNSTNLNQVIRYNAYAQGSNQQCGNQQLNRFKFNWTWDSSLTAVADFDPPADTKPIQNVKTAGEGDTVISASTIENLITFSATGNLNVNLITCDETTDCTDGGIICLGSICDEATKTCTPIIDTIGPISGPIGSWATLDGCYFGAAQGDGYVDFGGIIAAAPACSVSWQNEQILIEVPLGVSIAPQDVFVVTNMSLESNRINYTVTNDCSGVPVPPGGVPGLCSLNPVIGAINSNVRISGDNFTNDPPGPDDNVTFRRVPPPLNGRTQALTTGWTDTSIDATVPADATTGQVIVAVDSCPSNPLSYEVNIGLGTACGNPLPICLPDDSDCGQNTQLYCHPVSCTCQPAPPPNVISVIPGGLDVCRNAVMEVTFDQVMDHYSVRSNIDLKYADPLGICELGFNQNYEESPSLKRMVKAWFDKLAEIIFGNPQTAYGQVFNCDWGIESIQVYDVDDLGGDYSVALVTPSGDLAPETSYQLTVGSDVKNVYGVIMGNPSYLHDFTTQLDVCEIGNLDITVTPPGVVKSSDTFYCAGRVDCPGDVSLGFDGNQHRYTANARDKSGILLNVDYNWTKVDPDNAFTLCANATCIFQDSFSSEIFVTNSVNDGARATFIVGAHDDGDSSVGAATSTLLVKNDLCEVPWPERPDTPFIDTDTDFSMWYCRAKGENWQCFDSDTRSFTGVSCVDNADCPLPAETCKLIALPELTVVETSMVPIIEENDTFLKEFLFLLPAPSADAIALRAYRNSQMMSPDQWYRRNVPNQGSPQSMVVNGYQAVRDGRTVYVAAARQLAGGSYTAQMFLFSYNRNADPDTVKIYNGLLSSWEFTLNLLDLNVCSDELTLYCINDETCEAVNVGLCQLDATKIRRDTKRVTDLGSIYNLAYRYYGFCEDNVDRGCTRDEDCTGECNIINGKFPNLPAGSFVVGMSTSRWPSWNDTLKPALGVPSIPVDPFNTFNSCPAGYDPEACWDDTNKLFFCPAGSHIYQYITVNGGLSFQLYTNLELHSINWAWNGIGSGSNDTCDDIMISGTSGGDSCVNGSVINCGTSVGECEQGTRTCTGGLWGSCVGAVWPVPEICDDSLDNNCDGRIDENCHAIED